MTAEKRSARIQESDDETLVAAARDGDHLAFGELYRRYEPVFAAYISPRVGSRTPDVLQDAFLKILKGLDGYRGPRFFPWAYRICVNAVADDLRAKQRRAREDEAAREGVHRSETAATPEEELLAHRLGRQLEGALAALPTAQRAVFLLARIEGLAYGEIAELLGIPVGTVKSRMFGAVKALHGQQELV